MLNRSKFSPLFTDKFFTIPAVILNSNIELGFPIPVFRDSFPTFIRSRQGRAFREGVTKLLEELRKWSITNEMDASPLVQLLEKLIKKNVANDSFELFSDGITKLKAIIVMIQSGEIPHNVCVTLIRDLLPSLQMCESEVYKKIIAVHTYLTADIANELMLIRQTIAEQIVTLGIRNFNMTMLEYFKDAGLRFKIHQGDETHLGSAVLNHFAADIKIRDIHDPLTRRTDDDLEYLKGFFEFKIYSTLTFEAIIDELLFKLNLHEFATAMHSNPENQGVLIKRFYARLHQYGVDAEFNLLNLFDEDALANDEYQLAHDAESCLRISLMHRLANGGFLQLTIDQMIDQFISSLNLDAILLALTNNSNQIVKLILTSCSRLRDGNEAWFNFFDLFDKAAMDNNEYRLADDALLSLRACLKQRFEGVALKTFTHADATVSVLPGHDMSYSFVVTDEGRISLLAYCRKRLLADNNDFMDLIKEQRDKIQLMQSIPLREWRSYIYTLDCKSLRHCLRWMPKKMRAEYLLKLNVDHLTRVIANGVALGAILKLLPVRYKQQFLRLFAENLTTKQALDAYRDDENTYQALHAAKAGKSLFFTNPVNNMHIYSLGEKLTENILNVGRSLFTM